MNYFLMSAALSLVIFLLRDRFHNMQPWISNIWFIIAGILFLVGILRETGIIKKTKNSNKNEITQQVLIKKIFHKVRPPTLFTLFGIALFSFLLALGTYQIVFWVNNPSQFILNISTILIIFLFTFAPFYQLVDIFIISRKFFRISMTNGGQDIDYIVSGEMEILFDDCRRIFGLMKATNIKNINNNYIKAKINKCKISVKLSKKTKGLVNIYFISDVPNILLSNKRYISNNLSNIDSFSKYLYEFVYKIKKYEVVGNKHE